MFSGTAEQGEESNWQRRRVLESMRPLQLGTRSLDTTQVRKEEDKSRTHKI